MRIKTVEVRGLFGSRNLQLELPIDESIAFLHGHNGLGKSSLLRLLNGVLARDSHVLRSVLFETCRIDFADGASLCVRANAEPTEDGANYTYSSGKSKWVLEPEVETDEEDEERFLRRLTFSSSRLERRMLEEQWERTRRDKAQLKQPEPEWLTALLSGWGVKFIGANRLQAIRSLNRHRHSVGLMERVSEISQSLGQRIDEVRIETQKRSQQLDATFTERLVGEYANLAAITESEYRRKFDDVQEILRELREVGLAPPARQRFPEDTSQLQPVLPVLALALSDQTAKLENMVIAAKKILLFRESLNERFFEKQILINEGGAGFVIQDSAGREIDTSLLSSGEQHQIVLTYELIFGASGQTLFLVDEPELSFHVEWQTSFSRSLIAISETTGSEFILATHSPSIAADRWDLLITPSVLES